MTTLEVSAEELQAQARETYRRSAAEGRPLTRQQLGMMFERSESWARDRIAEVRREDDTPPDNGTDSPVVVSVPLAAPQPAEIGPEPPPADVEPAPVAVEDSRVMSPAPVDMSPADTPAGSHPGARVFAFLGFAFGSLVSVAANVLAAYLPAGDMPDNWSPSIASQIGAAVWPVALLVSVEVISRVAWPKGWLWALVRFGGVAAVGLGSALISYGHIHDVLLSWGYGPLGAGVGPLVIDGLMVVSGFALLAMSTGKTR